MSRTPIPLTRPVGGEQEVEQVARVIASGQWTGGEAVEAFEQRVAEAVGVRHAVATTSCTTALHLVLEALGVGPGDEVVVSDFTFPATANAVLHCGAKPVLCDVDPASGAMDPQGLEEAITERTRAVIVVHPFGIPADMPAINRVAAERGVAVIEDAACALGSEIDGRACGAMGVAGCFSFHPRKIISTGEGGMITTDDPHLASRARALRSHGMIPAKPLPRFPTGGYNYRLSAIAAAVGLAQMDRLEWILSRRRALAQIYGELLEPLEWVRPLAPTVQGALANYQSYVVVLDEGIDRDGLIKAMAEAGVETTIGTYAVHAQDYMGSMGYRPGELANSWFLSNHTLTLPLFPQMAEDQLHEVVQRLARAV